MPNVLKAFPKFVSKLTLHENISKYKQTFRDKKSLTNQLIKNQEDIAQSLKDGKYQAIEQDGLRFSANVPVMVFDMAAFAAENPEIYASYLKPAKQGLIIQKI